MKDENKPDLAGSKLREKSKEGEQTPPGILREEPGTPAPPARNKKKIILWLVVAAVCAVVFVVCAVQLAERGEEKRRQDELRQAAAAATAAPVPAPSAAHTPAASPTPAAWPLVKEYQPNGREIDFDKLIAENPDVIGWLEVPGTDVDYPLVADEGNYYLTHDVYGGESVYGAIYLDESNKGDLQQPHLIIYGHNMKDGSMFAGLHKFEDKAFFDENRLVKIYTPEGRLDFEIFAAHVRDDAYIPAVYGTEDKDGIARYLGGIAGTTDEKANLRMEGVTDGDAILTLSTCVRGEDEQRYVVEARYMESRAG